MRRIEAPRFVFLGCLCLNRGSFTIYPPKISKQVGDGSRKCSFVWLLFAAVNCPVTPRRSCSETNKVLCQLGLKHVYLHIN